MKREIKGEILSVARELFGTRGYNGVSMRDVADALGISVGNLTYHYPRKEDLIEAVVTEHRDDYRPPEPVQDLAGLQLFFSRQFRFQSERRYYFRHYTQLAEICPRLYALQRGVWQDMYVFLRLSLQALEENGLLRPETFAHQREGLLQAILLVCVHGEPHFERLGVDDSVEMGLRSLWSIVAPGLTQAGLDALRQLKT